MGGPGSLGVPCSRGLPGSGLGKLGGCDQVHQARCLRRRPRRGLRAPPPPTHTALPRPRRSSGAREVLHSSPWAERGARSPPPAPAFSCPRSPPPPASRGSLPGGEDGLGESGVWRCCQPRGERLDKYSPRGGGRRQGLSTSTAFGVTPQLARVTLVGFVSFLFGVCAVLLVSAATATPV